MLVCLVFRCACRVFVWRRSILCFLIFLFFRLSVRFGFLYLLVYCLLIRLLAFVLFMLAWLASVRLLARSPARSFVHSVVCLFGSSLQGRLFGLFAGLSEGSFACKCLFFDGLFA